MSDRATTYRGRRPSTEGERTEWLWRGHEECHVEPPPAYREQVARQIRDHADRVARELAALLRGSNTAAHNVPKAARGGAVEGAEERKRKRKK